LEITIFLKYILFNTNNASGFWYQFHVRISLSQRARLPVTYIFVEFTHQQMHFY